MDLLFSSHTQNEQKLISPLEHSRPTLSIIYIIFANHECHFVDANFTIINWTCQSSWLFSKQWISIVIQKMETSIFISNWMTIVVVRWLTTTLGYKPTWPIYQLHFYLLFWVEKNVFFPSFPFFSMVYYNKIDKFTSHIHIISPITF